MPDFLVTDPQGQRYKLTTPEGTTPEQAESELARSIYSDPRLKQQLEAQGPEQYRSRLDMVKEAAGNYFMPFSTMRHPDTPETRAAYDEALKKGPGKIPPVPGSPRFDPATGLGLDVAGNVAFKGLGLLKGGAIAKPLLGAAGGGAGRLDWEAALQAGREATGTGNAYRPAPMISKESKAGPIISAGPVNLMQTSKEPMMKDLDGYRFRIQSKEGADLGAISLAYDAVSKKIMISNIGAGAGGDMHRAIPHSLGLAAVRGIKDALKQIFPDATGIKGLRVSGARLESGQGVGWAEIDLAILAAMMGGGAVGAAGSFPSMEQQGPESLRQ